MNTLSESAKEIFQKTLHQLDNAEEMGGVTDPNDYIALMDRLILEIQQRKENCILSINC